MPDPLLDLRYLDGTPAFVNCHRFDISTSNFDIYKTRKKILAEQMTYRDIDIVGVLMGTLSE